MCGDWSFVLVSPTLFYFNLEKQENKTTPEQAGFNLLWGKNKTKTQNNLNQPINKKHPRTWLFGATCQIAFSAFLISLCSAPAPLSTLTAQWVLHLLWVLKAQKGSSLYSNRSFPNLGEWFTAANLKYLGGRGGRGINTPPKQNQNKLKNCFSS